MTVELTAAEANHILVLLQDNASEGWYVGNREQYEKRAERLKGKILYALGAKP